MSDPGVQASLHKNLKTTLPRINNYINSTRFREVNLVDRLYPDSASVELSHWALPGGSGAWEQWTFNTIVTQTFTPVSVGSSYGPTWTTHWFRLVFSIPDEWVGSEVRLRWASNSEAAVWSESGQLLQGLSTGTSYMYRPDYTLTTNHQLGQTGPYTLYVEMAANRLFGASGDGDNISPPSPDLYFTLSRAEIARVDQQVYKLTRDLEVLYQLADKLVDLGDQRGYQALYTANQMVNSIIAGQDSVASSLADEYFSKGNGSRAHTLAVMGNCHIDSAWLWPYTETKRKVARSFSSQLALMDRYPEHIFVASQAQQWQWCKQYFPELWTRVKERVTEGRFIPVGGTWVEMDGNIPSGESFIRQFLLGQKFYQKELGITCKEFWLPDTFGYSAQIPALMNHMGLKRFLTQKMSWSLVNKFPHHNFTWEGLDGSTVLAHFPPGDSYVMSVTVEEAVRTERNLQDKGRASTSAFLFGYGDGGGGPTQDMLERTRRLADTDGCPKATLMTPDQLFTQLESDEHNFCRWVGELYLELHNGTYTTHADMKRLCRRAELELRDAELLLSQAIVVLGVTGVAQLLQESQVALEEAWQNVLLNQFHDVLPGSCIGMVYPEAQTMYQQAIQAANTVRDNAAAAIFGSSGEVTDILVNTLPWPRVEVVTVGGNPTLVSVPSMGTALPDSQTPSSQVTLTEVDGTFVIENGLIRAEIDSYGRVTSLRVIGDDADHDVFQRPPGTTSGEQLFGNQIVMYDDEPLYYDAWDVMDYHLETPVVLNDADSGYSVSSPVVVENTPLLCSVRWGVTFGSSTFTQDIQLTADCPHLTFLTSVSWGENRKIIKALHSTSLYTNIASFDIQFGHLERPTHMNTSWDSARYEVCGHKWADLSEPDWGVAVLNDCKYGWMARGHTLALSLLRSPKAPDDTADMGNHTFKYALLPHQGTLQEAGVVQRAYEFNAPILTIQAPPDRGLESWVRVLGQGVLLHTVKPAEDGSGAVILRMYECNGTRSKVTLALEWPVTSVKECNGLEEAGVDVPFVQDAGTTSINLAFTPFSIKALRLTLQ
ncbi:hypothetical protein Pmani_001416 [Petrolisthes manimaculis]|uniref:alpha-mannosidase n=1 Tax=Petrolisthes manimaculis TaxID=1843537 RepID=A0AAE1QKL3_9EUCA|nr:hypothetical protein Pmani_001416 [Petrolisthes manimaculis]